MAMERSFREYCIRPKVDAPRKVISNPIQKLKTGEKQNKKKVETQLKRIISLMKSRFKTDGWAFI